jgi:glycosyltransferase involved in cell wall biosynthesis
MNTRHILLITDSYPPEIRSASHLMLELAEELTHRGHQVTVVTCWPQYNLDPNNKKIFSEVMTENSVRVIRMKHLAHHNVHFIIRGIAQLILPYLFMRKIKQYVHEKVDAVIVYSPPLPLAFVGAWAKKKWGAKNILNVQDLFPQNAIDLGVLKNKYMIRFFQWMEKWNYQHADVVTTHSLGNRDLLSKLYPDVKDKIKILHNWVDVAAHQNDMTQKDFRTLFELHHKFVAVFAGVIGPSQNLSVLIDAAEKLQHLKELCILIVGDGSEKQKLVDRVEKNKLSNVVFKPFISREEYGDLLKACDVGLVSLSSKNKTPVVPGKILGYMAAGLPVVAFLNKESDGHEIIKNAQCGYSVVSDNLSQIISVITHAYENKDRCKSLGESGLAYVKNNFSKESCVGEVEAFF